MQNLMLTPHLAEIQGQNRNFEHPIGNSLFADVRILSEICSICQKTATFCPAHIFDLRRTPLSKTCMLYGE